MRHVVSVMSPNPSKGYDRCFCIRMKSTLTKRGVHFKSSGYRVKILPFAVNTFLLDFLFVDIMYCACIIYLEDVFGFGI